MASTFLARIGRFFAAIWSYAAGTVRIFREFVGRVPTDLNRHLVAAMIMVAISVFGAVAAYRVALAEQRSVALERRLALGQLQDISSRQQLLAEVLVRIGLSNMEVTLRNEALDLRRAYKVFADHDGGASTWLEWHAAELMAHRNTLRRFSSHLRDLSDPKLNVEQELASRSAQELRRLGFLAVVNLEPAKEGVVEPVLSFPQLEHAIEKAHEVGPALAFCVLLFVFGLVCLTLAELGLGPANLWGWLVGAGTLVATGATIAVLAIDPAAWSAILLLTLLVIVVAFLAIRSGVLLKSHAKGHAPHPEAPEPARVSFAHLAGHSSHDNWSRSIVLLITLAVFTSAVFGWLYSVSLKHAGEYGLHAQEMRAELVNQRARLGAVTMGGVFDSSINFLVARIRCGASTQLAMLAADGQVNIDRGEVEKDREQRCNDLKKRTQDNIVLVDVLDSHDLADSSLNPAQRLQDRIMDRKGGPDQTFALSDGFAEASAGWFNRAALVLAVLTVLAITLYLFGQAYTMGETTAGRWLIGSGIALLCVSLGIGIYAWIKPVIVLPEEALPEACNDGGDHHDVTKDAEHLIEYAAVKYAEGVANQNVAATSLAGSAEQAEADAKAAAAFSCAILVRPAFIPAFQKYQRTLSRMNSPQRDESYTSLNSRTRLADLHDLQLRELRAFVKAGMLRPLHQLGNLAFDSTVLALAEQRPEALAEARTVLRTITGQSSWWERLYVEWMRPELWTDEPPSTSAVDWLNLALSQLASGDEDQIGAAEVTYDKALKQESGRSPELLASALTDLEILRAYCGNLYDDGSTCVHVTNAIERVRPRIASGAGANDLPKESGVKVYGFSASATPYSVEWQARIDGFDPKVDRLTVAWFRDDRPDAGDSVDATRWQLRRAIPDLFDIYHPERSDRLPAADQNNITRRTTMLPRAERWCLSSGRYVTELFLNGVQVASADVAVAPHDLHVYRSRDLDVTLCIPKTWEYWSGNREMHPWIADKPMRGFVDGGSTDNPRFGGAVMTFYAPPGMSEAKRRDYFLHRAIQILLRKNQRDAKGNLASNWTLEAENRLARNAIPIESVAPADCRSEQGLGEPAYRLVQSISDKNIVHIAVVDGKQPGKVTCAVLKSLTSYF